MSRKRWFSAERTNLDWLVNEHEEQFAFLSEVLPELAVSPVGRENVLLDDALVQQITDAGATSESEPTDTDGLECIAFFVGDAGSSTRAVPAEKHKVHLGGWNGDFDEDRFRRLVKKTLLSSLERNILVDISHGHTQKASTDAKKFHVWVWAGPKRTHHQVTVPHTMWGAKVACTGCCERVNYPDDGDGYVPIRTEEDDVVAVMNDKNLYILFDAVHYNTNSSETILRKIFEQTCLIFEAGMKLPEKSPEERKKISEAHCAAYVKLCMERVNGDYRELKRKVASLVDGLNKNRAEMMTMVADLDRTQRTLVGFSEATTKHADRFAAEWNALLRVPKVLGATCTGSGLNVMIDTIYVQHSKEKTWHKLGQFQVTIPTDGRITFRNLSGRKNVHRGEDDERWKLHAPHVFGDGHACFGNVENTVRELLAKHEYAALVQVLIMFLSHANIVDAAGQYLAKWPVATAAEALGKKKKTAKTPVKVKKRAA
jgi:hypothetical protein